LFFNCNTPFVLEKLVIVCHQTLLGCSPPFLRENGCARWPHIADHLSPPGNDEKGTTFRFCEIASGMGRHFLYMPSEVALGPRLNVP